MVMRKKIAARVVNTIGSSDKPAKDKDIKLAIKEVNKKYKEREEENHDDDTSLFS
jgi:hypothetical protein